MCIVIQNQLLTQTVHMRDTRAMIIIGLGNPGTKYVHTRHNAAWLVFDEWGLDWGANKYAESTEAKEGTFVFVKPQTFMNESGRSVVWYQKEFGLSPEDFVVVYDDVDLPVGTVRISFDRSSGGHNGIKSIEQFLGTSAFIRVRIGIAPVLDNGTLQTPESRTSFVLRDFSAKDLDVVRNLAPKIQSILETIETKGYVEAMNRFN